MTVRVARPGAGGSASRWEPARSFPLSPESSPGCSTGTSPSRPTLRRRGIARALRYSLDYLRYLEPAYRHAETLRARSRLRISGRRRVRDRRRRPERRRPSSVGRSRPRGRTGVADAAELVARIRAERAGRGAGRAADHARLAPGGCASRRAPSRRLPTVFPVASWDNLTNKGLVRDVPDADDRLERGPGRRGRRACTGCRASGCTRSARMPTTTGSSGSRARRASRVRPKVGLDPARPFFLYACSSAFIAGRRDALRARVARALRAAGGDLAEVGRARPAPPAERRASGGSVDLGDPQRRRLAACAARCPTDERAQVRTTSTRSTTRAAWSASTRAPDRGGDRRGGRSSP